MGNYLVCDDLEDSSEKEILKVFITAKQNKDN